MTVCLSLHEVDALTMRALTASNTSDANARSVTDSVVASEADGIHSHGLARLPTYCEHARCGKIDGHAEPMVTRAAAGVLRVDARDGFAHPAIDLGLQQFPELVRANGVGLMAVTNSYNCGVVGYHVERMADAGLVALAFVNAPASIAPWGGTRAVFGTNPIACAMPRPNAPPLVIDQSSSVVAKSEVLVHAQTGEPIPDGWAFDSKGHPTTDPKRALEGGTMAPSGGYKGAGIALLVEVMAAAVTGATLSVHASSFADNRGGSPRTGQLFVGIDPAMTSNGAYAERIVDLADTILAQSGARLPGNRRYEARARTAEQGVTIRNALHDKLLGYCSS